MIFLFGVPIVLSCAPNFLAVRLNFGSGLEIYTW